MPVVPQLAGRSALEMGLPQCNGQAPVKRCVLVTLKTSHRTCS
jgi:hypothetical protein